MNILSLPGDEARVLINETTAGLLETTTTTEGIGNISDALKRYTVFDLQYIGGVIRREVDKLPNPYRRCYRPYSGDLLDQYHQFMSLLHARRFPDAQPIRDPELWRRYWEMAAVQCFVQTGPSNDPFPQMDHPLYKFFYRLVYGYVMLIDGGYGHPIGMPFPGGATVKREGGRVLCPIRDKEKDLASALCNFCPAEQDPRYL